LHALEKAAGILLMTGHLQEVWLLGHLRMIATARVVIVAEQLCRIAFLVG
jgi:hypothetical protein